MKTKNNQIKRENAQKVLITIAAVLVCLIGIAGTAASGYWVFLSKNPQLLPTTTDVTYVSTVTDEETGAEYYFMEIDYWQNNNKLGREVFEFTFNAYTDYEFTAVKGRGVQFVNTDNKSLRNLDKWVCKPFDKHRDISWRPLAEDTFKEGEYLYVKLDGQPYAITMDGGYEIDNYKFDIGKTLKSVFMGLSLADKNNTHTNIPDKYNYTMLDFYQSVANSLTITSEKPGEYVLSLVEMSKFFSISRIGAGGRFEPLDKTTFQDDFFAVKVRLRSDGMVKAEQSNFGVYINNNNWSVTGLNDDVLDYSTVNVVQILSSEDFDYTFSLDLNAYVPSLRNDVKTRLLAAGIEKVSIKLDFNDNFWSEAINQYLFLLGTDLLDGINVHIAALTITYAENNGYIMLYIDKAIYSRHAFASAAITTSNSGSAPVQRIEFNFQEI